MCRADRDNRAGGHPGPVRPDHPLAGRDDPCGQGDGAPGHEECSVFTNWFLYYFFFIHAQPHMNVLFILTGKGASYAQKRDIYVVCA
jgi:hypothetical protein